MNISEDAKRLTELSDRARQQGRTLCSRFLSLSQQSEILGLIPDVKLDGGYEGAERRIAVFGPGEDSGYTEAEGYIACLHASPVSERFAQKLTHRDFLGSLTGLGITRDVLGDIVLHEGGAYIFCLETMAGFICDNLTSVNRTNVRCTVCEGLPEDAKAKPEPKAVNVASVRLDSLISAVFGISRNLSREAVEQGKVFINGKLTESASFQPKEGDIVSLRGKGRFTYEGVISKTKKDRLRVSVGVYK